MNNYFKTICCLFILISINVQAQISDTKVAALVEALRLGAMDGKLYSEWQIKPQNITDWSTRYLGKTITPEEFAANPAVARQILEIKMGNLLREQYKFSGQDETIAVLRTASWWMSGIPENYNANPKLEVFTQNILKFYQEILETPKKVIKD
ncbi:hypothetical protein QUF74_18665 [Candidatus Halobeggiatoa sp. HSG11]|nr:hypothetical protein [Candidatus Halobeggiatoa sp. HSG11]